MKTFPALIFFIILITQLNPCSAQNPDQSKHIQWMTFGNALKKSAQNPKKIYIDVYTNWCGWCKRMDATTFEDSSVIDFMNKNFYAVKLNAETKDTVYYQNKAYTFRPEYKCNEIAAYLLNGKMGYPTSVYLDESTNPITVYPGFLTKDQLIPVMKYFAGNFYKTKSWEDFVKEEGH